MSELSAYFMEIGEPILSGFYEDCERTKQYRYAKSFQRYFETVTLPDTVTELLYPYGSLKYSGNISPSFSFTYNMDTNSLKKKAGAEKYIDMIVRDMMPINYPKLGPHSVGGSGYTHCIVNFRRVEREGLNSYRRRIEAIEKNDDFRDGMLALLDGIAVFHERCLNKLRTSGGRAELITALERVPFEPARNLYEAMVCRNFIYFIDGCDNPGRLDEDLMYFYRGEDITPVFDCFFRNADMNEGWSAAVGPDNNPLLIQILHAIKGKRRPSIELRTTEDLPEEVWDAAADAVISGCGQPAFYNEKLYQSTLRKVFPEIPEEDIYRFNGGGCTETMLAGISHVGSLDAGINIALIFAASLRNELCGSESYDSYYSKMIAQIKKETLSTLNEVNRFYTVRAENISQPIRTLLVDDCIERCKDFNDGGARYNWSVVNLAGLINTIDSLIALDELVFINKEYTVEEFIQLLDAGDSSFFERLKSCRCFGVDDSVADAYGKRLIDDICDIFEETETIYHTPFLPASIQFTTYLSAGQCVRSTPDGRMDSDPLCDSLGAVHNRDTQGATALLNSVAQLPLSRLIGTPVVNLRMNKDYIRKSLKGLVLGFFAQGGMQLQISCISKADMEDALVHPENHENLIVRVGGYSEYFNRLSTALKMTVIERSEH